MADYIIRLTESYRSARAVAGMEPIALATLSKIVNRNNSRWLPGIYEGHTFTVGAFEQAVDTYARIWPPKTKKPNFKVGLRIDA